MAYTITPVLGMKLAVPGSGQAFETVEVNTNFTLIDTKLGSLAASDIKSGVFDPARIPAVDIEADNITDATSVGKGVLTAADEAAARTAIGAGAAGSELLTAATVIAAREKLRIFKNGASFTPQTDDLRYRDA